MSPPIWPGRNSFLDKRKTIQPQSYSGSARRVSSKQTEQQLIEELLSDLQNVINNNAQLNADNSSLRSDLIEVQKENESLKKTIEIDKQKLAKDLDRLQSEIEANKIQLMDSSKKCLYQQKLYVEQIKQLTSRNEQLTVDLANKENEFSEKMKKVYDEVKALQLSHKTLKTQNTENAAKSSKYKNKLKFAISIINRINNMLIECAVKTETCHAETQTGNDNSVQHIFKEDLKSSSTHLSNQTPKVEKLLLSKIFFRAQGLSDNELIMFNEKRTPQSRTFTQNRNT